MTFGEKLDALMRGRGLTQDALGKALGVTHRAVGGWLSGAKPHRKKAVELAQLFCIPLEVLLDDDLDLQPQIEPVVPVALQPKSGYIPISQRLKGKGKAIRLAKAKEFEERAEKLEVTAQQMQAMARELLDDAAFWRDLAQDTAEDDEDDFES